MPRCRGWPSPTHRVHPKDAFNASSHASWEGLFARMLRWQLAMRRSAACSRALPHRLRPRCYRRVRVRALSLGEHPHEGIPPVSPRSRVLLAVPPPPPPF
eukprot:2756333-Prymnesium_polylepis.1